MNNLKSEIEKNLTLDPENWDSIRELGHQMIDDIMDLMQNVSKQPVWKPVPDETKMFLQQELPQEPQNIDEIYDEFKQYIFPYPKGNIHPAFFAWIQGTGTPLGVLADMLASAMNSNVTIGEHSAMYVDRQVIDWCKQMLNYPQSATGILLSGGSMANITALTVARNHQLASVRNSGLKSAEKQMTIYCSSETHSCIQKAVEILGLGANSLRKIPVNDNYQINNNKLIETIENDLSEGLLPFCIIGNAGTVNTGAIDPLGELLEISRKYNLWFHIDGAYGALAKLDPDYAEQLKAIEKSDSVAFDLHKWLYMPYEVGCTLIKNAEAHRNAFAITPNYLIQENRGLAGGPDSYNNFGFELSRGFKALKVWMSLKEHGIKRYAEQIHQNNQQAKYLEKLIGKSPYLELLAPVSLSIVCYRFVKPNLSEDELNELNREILIQLQEQGIASPSSTILSNKFAIRVCIVNHRTKVFDLDLLISETVRIGMNI
ncbi:MAG: aminotransferase class V-fold PLP-dependent enzyme [Candidatus Kapabacteria bacterium]|nr:aminotransferase class V-fold PLP-dependent enzyme [Candidatus Kapabacteria bacterium]